MNFDTQESKSATSLPLFILLRIFSTNSDLANDLDSYQDLEVESLKKKGLFFIFIDLLKDWFSIDLEITNRLLVIRVDLAKVDIHINPYK